jgi:hypothetical protein
MYGIFFYISAVYDFNFPIVNFPFICSNIPVAPASGVYISQLIFYLIYFWCFNATFSNISAISWRPVLVVEVAGENHRPWASNW